MTTVYKVLREVREDGETYLASEMTESKFAITYATEKVNEHPYGTPLLAYREPPFYAPATSGLQVWEAESTGYSHGVTRLINNCYLEKLTVEQLTNLWEDLIVRGELSETTRKSINETVVTLDGNIPDYMMDVPPGTVAVPKLNLIRRLPQVPLPVPQLKYDPDGRHKYGNFNYVEG